MCYIQKHRAYTKQHAAFWHTNRLFSSKSGTYVFYKIIQSSQFMEKQSAKVFLECCHFKVFSALPFLTFSFPYIAGDPPLHWKQVFASNNPYILMLSIFNNYTVKILQMGCLRAEFLILRILFVIWTNRVGISLRYIKQHKALDLIITVLIIKWWLV